MKEPWDLYEEMARDNDLSDGSTVTFEGEN